MTDDSWRIDAACQQHPWEAWFPRDGEPGIYAKRICAGCPVLVQCRDYALAAEPREHGIWGGTSAIERVRIRRRAAGRKKVA